MKQIFKTFFVLALVLVFTKGLGFSDRGLLFIGRTLHTFSVCTEQDKVWELLVFIVFTH